MTEEKALKLYARGYNSRDFSAVEAKLHKKAAFFAYNRFYRHDGRVSVVRFLQEKAQELREDAQISRAYLGFVMVKRGLLGTKCESCVVLTRLDPPQAEGIVSIKCSPFRIREIQILDPAKCDYTRGNYAG